MLVLPSHYGSAVPAAGLSSQQRYLTSACCLASLSWVPVGSSNPCIMDCNQSKISVKGLEMTLRTGHVKYVVLGKLERMIEFLTFVNCFILYWV